MIKDRQYWYGSTVINLKKDQIFCFGSNPAGRHGAGAAKYARENFGAKYGQGRGLQGQSYGLITKNLDLNYVERSTGIKYDKKGYRSVSPEQIKDNIKELYDTAINHPDKKFLITYQYETYPNGNPKKSLNGYTSQEMIDMFIDDFDVPKNIVFHESYKTQLELKQKNKLIEEKKEKIQSIYQTYNDQRHLGLIQITNQETNERFVPFHKVNNVFSQFHPSPFIYKDKTFISCEQFMMYSKAKLFNDNDVAEEILNFTQSNLAQKIISNQDKLPDAVFDPDFCKEWEQIQIQIKRLGRKVKGFNQSEWDKINKSIIFVANREKYNQNETLKSFLLNTKGCTLVEASSTDRLYGVGLNKNHPSIIQPKQWRGQNLLGYTLTNLRDCMIQELSVNQTNNFNPQKKPQP